MSEEYKIKNTFKNLFNDVSAFFDKEEPRFFSYFGNRMVELSEIKEGDHVLDIATGRGASFFPAAVKTGESGKTIGTDISEEMVRLTSEMAGKLKFENTEVIRMDAENLDFQDNIFDHVLCGFGIFFFPDYKKALSEFKRVLKEGGKLSITTFLRAEYIESSWFNNLIKKYIDTQENKENVIKLAAPEFDTVEGLTDILMEAGFKNIEVLSEEKEFIYKNSYDWWKKQWTMATKLSLEKLTDENLEALKYEAFEILQQRKAEDGIHFKIPVLFAFGSK